MKKKPRNFFRWSFIILLPIAAIGKLLYSVFTKTTHDLTPIIITFDISYIVFAAYLSYLIYELTQTHDDLNKASYALSSMGTAIFISPDQGLKMLSDIIKNESDRYTYIFHTSISALPQSEEDSCKQLVDPSATGGRKDDISSTYFQTIFNKIRTINHVASIPIFDNPNTRFLTFHKRYIGPIKAAKHRQGRLYVIDYSKHICFLNFCLLLRSEHELNEGHVLIGWPVTEDRARHGQVYCLLSQEQKLLERCSSFRDELVSRSLCLTHDEILAMEDGKIQKQIEDKGLLS